MSKTFTKGETVWHSGFKMEVEFINTSPPIKKANEWYFVQLPNGGIHETQKIEKLKKK